MPNVYGNTPYVDISSAVSQYMVKFGVLIAVLISELCRVQFGISVMMDARKRLLEADARHA